MFRLLTFLILTLPFAVSANKDSVPDNEVDLSYIKSHFGHNISISYNFRNGKNLFSTGLKAHLNSSTTDDGYSYKNKGYADNLNEIFGVRLGYNRLFHVNEWLTPYLFINTLLSHLQMKTYLNIHDASGNLVGKRTYIRNHYYIAENYLGSGLRTKLSKQWTLNQSVGLGMAGMFRKASYNYQPVYELAWEPITMISVGLTYKFN